RGRVDAYRVDQEPPLDLEPRLPRSLALDLAAEDLEQHLGEPVLARVENREDDVGERPAPVLDERRAAPRAAVRERIDRARRPALDRDAVLQERRRHGPRGVEVRVGESEALAPRLPAQGHGPLRPDVPRARLPEEVVADRRAGIGRDGAGTWDI